MGSLPAGTRSGRGSRPLPAPQLENQSAQETAEHVAPGEHERAGSACGGEEIARAVRQRAERSYGTPGNVFTYSILRSGKVLTICTLKSGNDSTNCTLP